MTRLVPALFAALLFAGCSAGPAVVVPDTPSTPSGFPNHSAEQIEQYVAASTGGVRTFRAEARLAVRTATQNDRVGAGLRGRLTDSLLVSLRGPLGIEAGRGLVTADSVYGYDKINGRLYIGPTSAADRYVPGAGSPEALARNLLGLVVPAIGPGWTVRADSMHYVLTAPGNAQTYVVDPSLWRVVRFEERAADGSVVTRRTYGGFAPAEGGVSVARRVVLASLADDVTLTVEHQQVTVNPSDLRLRFERPRGVPVRRIE